MGSFAHHWEGTARPSNFYFYFSPFSFPCFYSSIFHWFKDENDEWKMENYIKVEPFTLKSGKSIPSLICDMLLSMDDNFMYFSNFFHGDVRQYDIRDPFNPKLVGQVWCGGLIGNERIHKGVKLEGGPKMMQLSLDGTRLYVTNSLFSSWDDQFYPNLKTNGYLIKIKCDNINGGMVIDEDFHVDFGKIENGPYRSHETRYPMGDCTSDIFLADQ
jgi:selenium-binding protein 1